MKSTLKIFHSCQWPPNIEQTIWPSGHTVWLNHLQDSLGTVEMKGYSAPLSTLVPLVELRSLSSEWISYRPRISLSSQNFQEFLFQQWQRFFLSLSVCYTPLSLSFIHTIYPHFYFLSVNRRYNIYKKSMWKIRFVRGFKLTNSQPRVS